MSVVVSLKERLKAGSPCLGTWITTADSASTEVAVFAGLDFVIVDGEHSALGLSEIQNHIIACRDTRTSPLVRVSHLDEAQIKRVLDLGAGGIIVPQIRSVEEVRDLVRFANYPPNGSRGFGPRRASAYYADKLAGFRAGDEVVVVPQVETLGALRDIEAIVSTSGVDCILIGEDDLATAFGLAGFPGAPEVQSEVRRVVEVAQAHGVPVAGLAGTTPESVEERFSAGYQLVTAGSDTAFMVAGLEAARRLMNPVSA